MKVIFTDRAWEQYVYWQTIDKKLLVKINVLIKEAARTPFEGIGKPEPLKNVYSGWWSRRINEEHRLVYRPTDDGLVIAQCRFHY